MRVQSLVKIALAASALVSLFSNALAAPGGMPPGVRLSQQVSPPQGIGPKKLQSSYLAGGVAPGAPLPQYVFTTIDSTTVTCAKANCTIGIETMGQIQPQGGDWAICLLVDGLYVSCPYQGVQAGPTGFVVGNVRGLATGIAAGAHTVDTQFYAEGANAIYTVYQSDIRVYK